MQRDITWREARAMVMAAIAARGPSTVKEIAAEVRRFVPRIGCNVIRDAVADLEQHGRIKPRRRGRAPNGKGMHFSTHPSLWVWPSKWEAV